MENYNDIILPWPGWKIIKRLGNGSYGTVYEIERVISAGKKEKSALKIISIPKSQDEVESYYSEGYDTGSIIEKYDEYKERVIHEYELMSEIDGNSYIVCCKDFAVIPYENKIGCDVFIRMELLTPLRTILKSRDLSEDEIISLGINICEALKLCDKKNIVHRDIKPENILFSEQGSYKLGDFGIARTLDHETNATYAGTQDYMAPEVANGRQYGKTVDIYSLGLVLYWLLNKKRMPFLPLSRMPSEEEKSHSRRKRIEGVPLPSPANGSQELKLIVLKACEYDPEKRFTSAEEMCNALEAVKLGRKEEPETPDGVDNVESFQERVVSDYDSAFEERSNVWHDITESFRKEKREPNRPEDKEIDGTMKVPTQVYPLEDGEDNPDNGIENSLKTNKRLYYIAGITLVCVITALVLCIYGLRKPEDETGQSFVQDDNYNINDDVEAGENKNIFLSAATGDTVIFGQYEQDNNAADGQEPIEWIVLAKNEDMLVLISKYGLDVQQYHNDWDYNTWEYCSLRRWLNVDFLDTAFSAEEQSCILSVQNQNPDNPTYNTSGGNNTVDRVFILSFSEAEQFFSGNSAGIIQNTEYANAQIKEKNSEEVFYCWLRSPGNSGCQDASVVDTDGNVNFDGKCVDKYEIVRPVICIDISQ